MIRLQAASQYYSNMVSASCGPPSVRAQREGPHREETTRSTCLKSEVFMFERTGWSVLGLPCCSEREREREGEQMREPKWQRERERESD